MKTYASTRTVSCMLAALFSVIAIDSCKDDDGPAVVTIAFGKEFQVMTEGDEAIIAITLDRPSPVNANVRVAVQTDAIYGKNYDTYPVIQSEGETQLLVKEGQDRLEVKLRTVDDTKFTDTRFLVLRLMSSTAGFKIGNPSTHTITIYDDEGPSIPFFSTAESDLQETNVAGQQIKIRLSSPAAGEGSFKVGLDPGKAVAGTHFTIDQELTDNTFTIQVAAGDTAYAVGVFPVDNDVFTGDFELEFDILEVSGVTRSVDTARHVLTLKDDELPTIVQFASASDSVEETRTTPYVVDLALSSPVKGEGEVKIKIGEGAKYGEDFVTIPEAQDNFVVLKLSHDQAAASFSVSVIDDDVVGGNLKIPFSIRHGMAPIFSGTDNQEFILTVVDNEKPTVVDFTTSTLSVDEASTTGIDVEIVLSAPAPQNGGIVLQVQGSGDPRDEVVCDPPIEKEFIFLDVPSGAERVSFHVDPIDNSSCGDHQPVTFSIFSASNTLTIGSKSELRLNVLEDEPHTAFTLVENEGVLAENAGKGLKVELKASGTLSSAVSLYVSLDYNTNYHSGRFSVVPDFLESSYSGYVYGYLEYTPTDTSVGFEIVPKNDFDKNGDFTETFYFQADNRPGRCIIIENGPFVLDFIDDD
ncbi:MAG TPA: Calx-beta domain-containing protein [Cyclobacteriaceae bacterium]|nr:Calx-beta domain-containing protein [Cyclobacteriaceae bacterium]